MDHLAQRAMRHLKIKIRLQAQPKPLTGSQRRSQAHGGIRRDAALAEHDLVDASRRHASSARQCVQAMVASSDGKLRNGIAPTYARRCGKGERDEGS